MKTLIIIALMSILTTSARAEGICKIQICATGGAKVSIDGLTSHDSCGDRSPLRYREAIEILNHHISTHSCKNINVSRCQISNCPLGSQVEFDGGVILDKCLPSTEAIRKISSFISAGECL